MATDPKDKADLKNIKGALEIVTEQVAGLTEDRTVVKEEIKKLKVLFPSDFYLVSTDNKY